EVSTCTMDVMNQAVEGGNGSCSGSSESASMSAAMLASETFISRLSPIRLRSDNSDSESPRSDTLDNSSALKKNVINSFSKQFLDTMNGFDNELQDNNGNVREIGSTHFILNGENPTEEEKEVLDGEDFVEATELSFSKDSSYLKGGGSPVRSFKSSYAQSLADSYRRASLPVVVSAPKGEFYFKDDEFLSLSSTNLKRQSMAPSVPPTHSVFNQDKFLSLNTSSATGSPSLSSLQPLSLPTILDVVPLTSVASQENPNIIPVPVRNTTTTTKNHNNNNNNNNKLSTAIDRLMVDKDVFVPYENLLTAFEDQVNFSTQDWLNLPIYVTADGRKLVRVAEFLSELKHQEDGDSIEETVPTSLQNGRSPSTAEEEVLSGRVSQLCEVLAQRDDTIQRLEEDLLRMRMESQRLMVENRSIRSGLSQAAQPPGITQQAQQQIDLLNAQLDRAERSRHTYEAATRQLVDFLHTVNSTLTAQSHNGTPSVTTSSSNSSHTSSGGGPISASYLPHDLGDHLV
ncbi:unnamed protein product, partial [Meganyctiphanes norvegica]